MSVKSGTPKTIVSIVEWHKERQVWKETICPLDLLLWNRMPLSSSLQSRSLVCFIWTVSRFSVGDDRENASTKHQRRRSTGQHLYRSNVREKLVPRCFVSFTFRHRWASSLQCRVDPESVCSRLSALDNRQTIQGGKEKVFIRCFLTVSPKVCVPAIWMPDANDRKGNTKPRAILCFYANIG